MLIHAFCLVKSCFLSPIQGLGHILYGRKICKFSEIDIRSGSTCIILKLDSSQCILRSFLDVFRWANISTSICSKASRLHNILAALDLEACLYLFTSRCLDRFYTLSERRKDHWIIIRFSQLSTNPLKSHNRFHLYSLRLRRSKKANPTGLAFSNVYLFSSLPSS